MLIASIISIVIIFLLLGHYSQKCIWTRVLYSLILIFVVNLVAALITISYLPPYSDTTKPLSIMFVMLVAYSLYYLYKMIKNPKKMTRWCWLLLLLFFAGISTYCIRDTVRYINRSSFQDQGYIPQHYVEQSYESYIQGIYSIEIKGNVIKILTTENGIQYLEVGEKILFPVIDGSYEITYIGQEGEKLNFYHHGLSHTWANNNQYISVKPYTLKEYFKNRGYYGVYGLFELIYYLRKNQNEKTTIITQQLKNTLQNDPSFSVDLVCMPHSSTPDQNCVDFITNLMSN